MDRGNAVENVQGEEVASNSRRAFLLHLSTDLERGEGKGSFSLLGVRKGPNRGIRSLAISRALS